MEFEEAVECLKNGERIKRGSWKKAYLKVEDKKVKMFIGFKKPWGYQFRHDDIFARDWAIDTNNMFVDEEDSLLKPLSGVLSFHS